MRCSSLAAAVVVAVGPALAGCASTGPRAAEMENVRARRACQVRPEACGPEAGLEAWAAGLRRLRAEQCGADHGRGDIAAEFVCEEPVRFVRYDFDLMPWIDADWASWPGPARNGALLCLEGGGFAAVDSSFRGFWVPVQYYRQEGHPLLRLIPQQRMTGFIRWARRACSEGAHAHSRAHLRVLGDR